MPWNTAKVGIKHQSINQFYIDFAFEGVKAV